MIFGIGIDTVDLNRIATLLQKNDRFLNRILTAAETSAYRQLKQTRAIEFVAGRFAAKEAFSKAYGTGIGPECSFQDIEILNTMNGKPIVTHPFELKAFVSITHTDTVAMAQVILEERD
ncbi:holo-ACP synthase [Brochothrix campestris]